MTKVLIVSNDNSTKFLINKTLTYDGFIVQMASDSSFAWKHLQEMRFDFIMIDMELNDESGLGFYKCLRQIGNNIPVIMIGEGELDKFMLQDLSMENYDFILKPLTSSVLKLRVKNFIDKYAAKEKVMYFGNLKIDSRQQLLIFKNKLLQLSKMELDILVILAQKSGEVIHPKRISKMLGKEGMSIFYYISKLREKLQKYGGEALDISFIKDQGYRLTYT